MMNLTISATSVFRSLSTHKRRGIASYLSHSVRKGQRGPLTHIRVFTRRQGGGDRHQDEVNTILKREAGSLAHFRIVSINDVYDLSNLPRMQTFLKTLSPKPSAVLLCGDFLSPSTLSSIDGGRGMVATLKTVGITHVSFGNHEQDLRLDALRQRLEDLSSSSLSSSSSSSSSSSFSPMGPQPIQIVNSNMQKDLPEKAKWMGTVTKPYSVLESSCGKVKLALLGLLSDEPGIFRDNTFKSVPIQDVLETYTEMYQSLVQNENERDGSNINNEEGGAGPIADFLLPMTHQSMIRDKELARQMLLLHKGPGLILGGHEHDPYNEIVTANNVEGDDGNHDDETLLCTSAPSDGNYIRILKSGMDANAALLVDLIFEVPEENVEDSSGKCQRPRLMEIKSDLVPMQDFEPSNIAQQVVDKHMSVIQALENEIVIDADTVLPQLPIDVAISSKRSRFQQTTVGTIFCQMIKEELHESCDAAMINGASIKGGRTYPNGRISYAELKSELPFPTKMVIVAMKPHEVYEAILYSRTAHEDGTDPDAEEIPRRGYLQLDYDLDQRWEQLGYTTDMTSLRVALPRNLLNGFCKNKPLMAVGSRLQEEGLFPGTDDFVPAIDLIVRHACKNRWYQLVGDKPFNYFDVNNDGVLDRDEIKMMLKDVLGYEPADFVVDDMIASVDQDDNGVIDQGEFSFLLAQIEREHNQFWK